MKRILGIDPGLRRCGWGIVSVEKTCLTYLSHGTIKPNPDLSLAERLKELYQSLSAIIQARTPTDAAIEETFVNKNPTSALKLAHARGVLLMTPTLWHIPVTHYTANQIKKALTGVGHATKHQVSSMVKTLLPQTPHLSEDAADALAIAICHAHTAMSLTSHQRRRA